ARSRNLASASLDEIGPLCGFDWEARRLLTSFLFLRYHRHSFKVWVETLNQRGMIFIISREIDPYQPFGVKMGEVIRFVPGPERERARLIREARAMYDSIFPPTDPFRERQDKASMTHSVRGDDALCKETGRAS